MKTTPIAFFICCIAMSVVACNKEVPSATSKIDDTISTCDSQVYVLVKDMDTSYMKRLHFEAIMKGYASSY